MFITLADKPGADVAYLTAAITRQALVSKFKSLFGREPVAVDNEPLVVKQAKVPEMVLSGVDHDIVSVLQASAVEQSTNAEAALPELNAQTLLYVIHDDTPASIALTEVQEYTDLGDTQDAVTNDLPDINVTDGVAYLSKAASTLAIGIYVLNSEFGELFQYRLENEGGNSLPVDKKVEIFDELYNELPGGEANKEQNTRSLLLTVVGLAEVLPVGQRPVAEDMQAPGPGGAK